MIEALWHTPGVSVTHAVITVSRIPSHVASRFHVLCTVRIGDRVRYIYIYYTVQYCTHARAQAHRAESLVRSRCRARVRGRVRECVGAECAVKLASARCRASISSCHHECSC
jgi:hypothetical protein